MQFTYPWASIKDVTLQGSLQLSKINFINFFLFLWVIAFLDPQHSRWQLIL
jgi:hypothetical protein